MNYANGVIPFSQSSGAVDIGMNNVPVLDQGSEGTCVTFASTGALDAILGRDDFISQQCSLNAMTLSQVRDAINKGHRVTIGFGL